MSDGRPSRLADRALEVLAVVLLGIATVGMASCALQSQLWSGEGERLGALAATEHPEANRLFGLATQTISYDANTVTGYAQAVRDGDEKLKQFFRSSLMRKGFLSYLDQWEAQVKAGQSPQNLLEDSTYLDPVMQPYRTAQSQAEADSRAGDQAGHVGDQYTLATVLLAVSLFFAGVTSSFRSPTLRTALLVTCGLILLVSILRLAELPIAAATWSIFEMS